MAVTKIKTVFQFRRATLAEWTLNKDVIPAEGEPCFVTDKNILKIGDGVTTFENLEPINGVKFEITADGKSIVLEDNILKLMGFEAAEVGAQPRKGADGNIEWIVPSTEAADMVADITVLKGLVGETSVQDQIIDAVSGLVKAEDGKGLSTNDFTDNLLEKLDGIETGAQVNKIEEIYLGTTLLEIIDKKVVIPVGAGLKSSDEIDIAEDGTLSVKTISFDKIMQDTDYYIIMDGGSAI